MATKQQQAKDPAVLPIFEVLTRNRLGRETVHRGRHENAEAAVEAVVADPGIDRDQVVEVRQVTAS
jgi:hypothetical protein